MKTINRMIFATAAMAVLAAGCSKDATKDIVEPAAATRTIEVTAGYDVGDDSRANYTDGKGLTWANNDVLWAGYTDKGNINGSVGSTGINIDGEGTAAFTLTIPEGATMLCAFYPEPEGKHVASDYTQPMFRIGTIQTQPKAGAMTNMQGAAGFIGTSVQNVSDASTSYTTQLKALTSIVRFIIYSSDAKHNDYLVESVSLQADKIAGLYGQVTPWNGVGNYMVPTPGANTVTVELDTPYSLSGITSQANAAGIYMGVMPTTSNGSTITVYTDKGRIAFESTKTKEYKANTIHNVYLDLAKGTVLPVENKLVFTYGNPIDHGEFNDKGDGVFYNGAIVSLTLDGRNITKRATANPNAWSLVADYEGAEPWLGTVDFENRGNFQWKVTATPNKTAKERKAKVYLVYDGIRSVNYITFTQDAGSGVEIVPTLTKDHNATISKDGATIEKAATLVLTVNGDNSSDVAADMEKYGVTLTCGAATAEVNAAGDVKIVFPKNDYASEKTYTLEAKFEDVSSKVTFTQEANEGGTAAFPYTYEIEFAGANKSGIAISFGANVEHDGVYAYVRNVKQNGENVTLNDDVVAEVVNYAFKSVLPTDAEKASVNMSHKNANTESFARARYYVGAEIQIAFTTGSAGGITKIVLYNYDGSELGHYFVCTD